MFIAERNKLMPVRILINNIMVRLELFENMSGNMFLSSQTVSPGGTVYYAITPSQLNAFLQNTLTLQALFNQSPSVFMEIVSEKKSALYSFKDTEVLLVCGNKTIRQLSETGSFI